jgi:3-oxoacyl-[acyl-carrier protein] reductase
MTSNRFAGKIALITGGGGNIARTTALQFSREGGSVAVCDFNMDTANRVRDEIISSGGEAISIHADVKKYVDAQAAVERTLERFGQIDILVTAAGGSTREKARYFCDQSIEVIEDNIGVNLFGQLYFAHAVSQHMVSRSSGRIIFIASVLGIQGNPRNSEYSAAKGGVIIFARSLAMELGEFQITVNCVSPGLVERGTADVSSHSFIQRNETPQDVSNVITFLASEEASFVTGQNYVVDGGWGLGVQSNIQSRRNH